MDNQEWTIKNGQSRMDNQEWTIKNGQSRMGNQEWTIKNGQSRMDNQEWTIKNGQSRATGYIVYTRHKMKTHKKKIKHNTICVGHHYMQTNTNNVKKT